MSLSNNTQSLQALLAQAESMVDGGNVNLQNKIVDPSASIQVIVPDEGYDGLGTVTVEAINLQNKNISPTTSTQNVIADEGYDGLGQVTVEAIEKKTVTINIICTGGSGLIQYKDNNFTTQLLDIIANDFDYNETVTIEALGGYFILGYSPAINSVTNGSIIQVSSGVNSDFMATGSDGNLYWTSSNNVTVSFRAATGGGSN